MSASCCVSSTGDRAGGKGTSPRTAQPKTPRRFALWMKQFWRIESTPTTGSSASVRKRFETSVLGFSRSRRSCSQALKPRLSLGKSDDMENRVRIVCTCTLPFSTRTSCVAHHAFAWSSHAKNGAVASSSSSPSLAEPSARRFSDLLDRRFGGASLTVGARGGRCMLRHLSLRLMQDRAASPPPQKPKSSRMRDHAPMPYVSTPLRSRSSSSSDHARRHLVSIRGVPRKSWLARWPSPMRRRTPWA
mmetsp:Transcript_21425/g.74186  ORF Transcript_21425/g.74186 Transcript_21425/m.74186 type:complete len:246 (+) Transcript_21425:57-794(+)